jgi:hypothetical protein
MARRATGGITSAAFDAARRSRYWCEADARVVLAAYRASGRSLKAFARQTGLSPQRIRWWRERMPASATPTAPTFLPVEVVAAPVVPGQPVEIVVPSGHVVRVTGAFDTATLARVLAVLAGAPC